MNISEEIAPIMKVILTGDSGSGKTCLLNRWADDTFQQGYLATIGVDFKMQKMNLLGKNFKIQIWDTAGQERFRSITANYYRGCHANIIVCDVSREDCIESVENWLGESLKYSGVSNNLKSFLFATKTDSGYRVPKDVVMSFANRHGLMLFDTSAKSGWNVKESFQMIFEIVANEMLYKDSDAQTQRDKDAMSEEEQIILKRKENSTSSKCKC